MIIIDVKAGVEATRRSSNHGGPTLRQTEFSVLSIRVYRLDTTGSTCYSIVHTRMTAREPVSQRMEIKINAGEEK